MTSNCPVKSKQEQQPIPSISTPTNELVYYYTNAFSKQSRESDILRPQETLVLMLSLILNQSSVYQELILVKIIFYLN